MKRFVVQLFLVILSNSNAMVVPIPESANLATIKPLTEPKCSVALDLSNMNFGPKLNYGFISSPYITNLTLQNNRLTDIEYGAFNGVPNLKYLDLSHNYLDLTKLFSFGEHRKLETLILDYNNGGGSDNTNLVQTTTERNYDYGWSPRWTTERVNYTTTTTERSRFSSHLIFNGMSRFTELKNLSLRYINMQSASSDWDYKFPNLYHLDISGNKFHKPHILGDILSIIKSLTLMNTGLTKLGGSSLFKNIKNLNVAQNKFNSLSYSDCDDDTLCLNNFENLQSLVISNCGISNIEQNAFKNLENLLELDMSGNRFDRIPDGTLDYLIRLTRLDLSRNILWSIPNFSKLQDLSILILNYINREKVTSLIEGNEFPNLKILSLQGNNIQFIPENFLNDLPALQELDLSHNQIGTLPAWESSNVLLKLDLKHNAISSLDNITSAITESLKILDIGDNGLKKIEVKSLKKLSDDAVIIL